jgi:hypothetical protein
MDSPETPLFGWFIIVFWLLVIVLVTCISCIKDPPPPRP